MNVERLKIKDAIDELLSQKGIRHPDIAFREYPDELIVVISVGPDEQPQALTLTSEIDAIIPGNGFSVIRTSQTLGADQLTSVSSVSDEKVTRLIELLNERSRTSEQQPSLSYIPDAASNLRIALTRRHHLIFGRRGVGKTALLLEAKTQIERTGAMAVWVNMQSLRELGSIKAFLNIVQRVCELPRMVHRGRADMPQSVLIAANLDSSVRELLARARLSKRDCAPLVAEARRMIDLLCSERASDLYIFVDDVHYLEMKTQPVFLDLLHSVTRDTAAWLKVAGIRNQCRVFTDNPPVGLQIGHDAALIQLDITLEEPKKARDFLSNVLQTYLRAAGVANRSGVLTNAALERLVLASGGVPRDFLLLSARSIQIARQRANARSVGIQDVNQAAGDAGKQKRAELEDDAASAIGQAALRLNALEVVRAFAIDQNHCSFFRIDFRDKEARPDEYRLLQSLMDLRMLHLIKASLSEAHGAGERSEVYMIDLSEFSGSRLKKRMSVIELWNDNLVLRRTGQGATVLIADTGRKLVQLFRTGPLFALDKLAVVEG
jgi:AAA ATPase domain